MDAAVLVGALVWGGVAIVSFVTLALGTAIEFVRISIKSRASRHGHICDPHFSTTQPQT